MASFNKVILLGNLTRDPEVRYTAGGSAVTEVSLAVNRQWTDRQTNERKEEVTFVEVTLWGRTAEVAGEYLSKGRPCLIEGRLQLDRWEDKETGKNRSKLKVVGETLQLLSGKSDNDGGSGGGAPSSGYSKPAPAAPRQQSAPAAQPAAPPSDSRTPDQAFYDDNPAPQDDDVPF
ncbi:MAG: single-stranded DNA-binding protein [Fuerstiella sp.]